jgi:hypothetical protein
VGGPQQSRGGGGRSGTGFVSLGDYLDGNREAIGNAEGGIFKQGADAINAAQGGDPAAQDTARELGRTFGSEAGLQGRDGLFQGALEWAGGQGQQVGAPVNNPIIGGFNSGYSIWDHGLQSLGAGLTAASQKGAAQAAGGPGSGGGAGAGGGSGTGGSGTGGGSGGSGGGWTWGDGGGGVGPLGGMGSGDPVPGPAPAPSDTGGPQGGPGPVGLPDPGRRGGQRNPYDSAPWWHKKGGW